MKEGNSKKGAAPLSALQKNLDALLQNKAEAPGLLGAIFATAVKQEASDIHLEPRAGFVLVRFRLDGVLRDAARLPSAFLEPLVNLIKIQAELRIDEHASSQDGAIRYEKDGVKADFRVSILPTIAGEKVAVRILLGRGRRLTLDELGLSPEQKKLAGEKAREPYGMILVTGPTGSGKTTTLYGLVQTIHGPDINITTIEDPVEYAVEGLNQVQVNRQSNLTFDKGLRAIVRQDPNVILVGEIRDLETAKIAVNAALTGHRLLSTFHANDAAAAIPRLITMGIEPYLLASSLELIVAQRLVRSLCPSCKVPDNLTRAALIDEWPRLEKFLPTKLPTFYAAQGCNECLGSGYQGRVGMFEFLEIDPAIQDLILARPSAKQVRELARASGQR